MKPEQQRVAIAEACGWKFVPEPHYEGDPRPEFTTITPEGRHLCGFFPDYLNDLNAMHEAEKVVRALPEKRITYAHLLMNYAGDAYHATAAQRAEAFLRTLNLWVD